MITPESWPTDPQQCHDLLSRLTQQVEDLQAALDEAAKIHEQTVQRARTIVEELRQQLSSTAASSLARGGNDWSRPPDRDTCSTRTSGSVALPPEPPACDPQEPAPARPRQSRKLDYDRLPQVRIQHDVPEADKICSHCGEAKARIGEDEARVLNFIPAHFELQVHVLPKYACSHCRDGVVAPEGPPRP